MHVNDLQLPFSVSTLGNAKGTPAIVIPGGPCRGPEYLEDFAQVGDHRPLVVLHPRGTPRSGGQSHGWWQDANDVILLADALGLETIDLVAHSAGTRLALATAARFPHRVRSLALITPPASWLTHTPSDVDSLADSYVDNRITNALEALEDDDARTESEFQALFLRQAPASYANWTAVEKQHACVGAVSLSAALAWFKDIPEDVTDRITQMSRVPALVIGGDRDFLTGVKPVQDYATLLDAELVMIENCGHYPWIEQAEAFRDCLFSWLSTRNR